MLKLLAIVIISVVSTSMSWAECLKVNNDAALKISNANQRMLNNLKIDRGVLFRLMKTISIPETEGCWAGPSGDFDGQLVSTGVLQWNYGQKSLPSLMRRFKEAWGRQFTSKRQELMPKYGSLVFSKGCLKSSITTNCRMEIMALQSPSGKLKPEFSSEWTALFESRAMRQIQLDKFLRVLSGAVREMRALFPNENPPPLKKLAWLVDTRVQQGAYFPTNKHGKHTGPTYPRDAIRLIEKLSKSSPERKRQSALKIIHWYDGHCGTIDQDGVRLDCKRNVEFWTKELQSPDISDDTIELLHLTYLKSRTARGRSGLYQGDTFQRRATFVFGGGSVHGNLIGTLRN